MNGELLILFVILLLGLILCSFLGGNGCMEGFTNDSKLLKFTSTDGSTAVVSSNKTVAFVTKPDGTITNYTQKNTIQGPYGSSGLLKTKTAGTIVFYTTDANDSNRVTYTNDTSTNTSNTSTNTSTNDKSTNEAFNKVFNKMFDQMLASKDYDNYNHYDGTSYPTIFYGSDGGTAKVIQTPNNNTLVITNKNGTTKIYYIDKNNTNSNVTSYYGPTGGSAKILTDNNGKQTVEITDPNGPKLIYTGDNTNANNSQDNTINQYSSDSNTTGSDYDTAYSSSTNYGGRAGSDYDTAHSSSTYNGYSGPRSATVTGPGGNTYSTYDSSAYTNSLPQGVSRSQIPSGQEDLYILKSQVVPPVCAKCPDPIVQCPDSTDVTKCPPCAPCSRCVEPSYTCKKVPNYKAFNQDYMPVPVLSDFSSFGM
jgi:hypothetical protein